MLLAATASSSLLDSCCIHLACRPSTGLPHPLKVGEDGGTVLQAGGGKLKLGALLLQQLAQQTTFRDGSRDASAHRRAGTACKGCSKGSRSKAASTVSGAPGTHRSSRTCQRLGRPAGAAGTGGAGFGWGNRSHRAGIEVPWYTMRYFITGMSPGLRTGPPRPLTGSELPFCAVMAAAC